jgi:hypothetical protein
MLYELIDERLDNLGLIDETGALAEEIINNPLVTDEELVKLAEKIEEAWE